MKMTVTLDITDDEEKQHEVFKSLAINAEPIPGARVIAFHDGDAILTMLEQEEKLERIDDVWQEVEGHYKRTKHLAANFGKALDA